MPGAHTAEATEETEEDRGPWRVDSGQRREDQGGRADMGGLCARVARVPNQEYSTRQVTMHHLVTCVQGK